MIASFHGKVVRSNERATTITKLIMMIVETQADQFSPPNTSKIINLTEVLH